MGDTQVQEDQPASGKTKSTSGLGGALVAAGAAVLCCVGPLVPILLGLGSASALFGLDRYQPWFIGLGLVLLALAAWMAVRRQNRCCAVKSAARSARTVALVFSVGIGAYLLLQFAVVPALASLASERVRASRGGDLVSEVALKTATVQVEGMTCAGCAVGVEAAFLDLPGVGDARVDWQTGEATVRYDPEIITENDLLRAPVEPPYTLQLRDPEASGRP
ncbi:MAG: mercuric transporter MerT family protein [Opitutales bacterium]